MSDSAPAASELRVVVIADRATAARLGRSLKADGIGVLASVGSVARLESSQAAAADAVVVHLPEFPPEPSTRASTIRDAAPEARVVVVAPRTTMRQLRTLLDQGVDALVLESDAAPSLGPAVRSACSGLLAIPSSLKQSLVTPVLSTREKQVLGLVVLGLTNAEIARKLHLAESTVKSHLSSSFSKLGVRSRSEATAMILDPATGLGTGILTIVDPG